MNVEIVITASSLSEKVTWDDNKKKEPKKAFSFSGL